MFKALLQGAAVAALLAASASAQPASPPAGKEVTTVSGVTVNSHRPAASDFGRLPAIAHVSISPDGKHIAAITTPDGVTGFISVWSTDAMDQKPYIIPPTNMQGFQFFDVQFVKNDRLFVTFRTLVAGLGNGDGSKNQRFIFQSILMSPSKDGPPPANIIPKRPAQTDADQFMQNGLAVRIVNVLPGDPKRVLVRDETDGTIYRADVMTGQLDVVQRGSDTYGYYVDPKGEPRGRERSVGDGGNIAQLDEFKTPNGGWQEGFKWLVKDREQINFAAFDDDPNAILAVSRAGHEKAVIESYDITGRKPPEVAFGHPFFEATGVVRSRRSKDYGHVLGFTYNADTERTYWTDGEFEALEKNLRAALGVTMDTMTWTDPATGKEGKIQTMHDYDVSILGYSDDMSRVLVEKSGPSQPPEYYLLKDNKLILLGKSDPQIDLQDLGHTRMVEYPARDGLIIPAFVTTPNKALFGPGPYPTIVTPHGGPWGRDELEWDPTGWTQYFAARGYAVIQPQFRGSDGWGQKLWRAGDREWGGKMEDDMEDGLKWMIAQGITDPKRVAIHGYSYGGYAAFDASVRPNGLYRCAIAGAGVSEIARFQELTNQNDFIRNYQRPTVEGVSPLQHISDVTIPVLAYHGDTDHTVSRTESERFTNALAAAHRPYKFVELPNMDHQLVYWTPQNWRDILLTVDDFLKTSCQMGTQ
ncbi:MAG TPA: prolyl oligopeptidase family serine peptidase [Caulobacteraceae bacterium]|jgi:dipeptidyl aminopeptidase/acylaminoacyl peptidase|nr:prolyl oligopeptidase family serine peptidase [Caulobacteraceae bacterium]